MCGIVGYVGPRNACDVLLEGLRRLEYRGYDSAGLAVWTAEGLRTIKEVGKVAELADAVRAAGFDGFRGIGHTRWATHGGVTQANAHPHADDRHRFALVHNGIVENYSELREELEKQGAIFSSETDSEVVVQLLARIMGEIASMPEALRELQGRLQGSFALAIMDGEDPDHFFCVRRGSPLVLGLGKGEAFCASDVSALLPYTREVIYLEDGDMARLGPCGATMWNATGEEIHRPGSMVDWDVTMAEKDGFPHYMLKEIHEQGGVLRAAFKGRIFPGGVDLSGELDWDDALIRSWKRIHVVACGTAHYASLVGQRVLERWTGLEVLADIASEYRYRPLRADADTLAIFVSQSGETADTLAALRKARSEGARCLAVTNVRGSTLAREVHDTLLLRAGPEIGVAATKTFMGQMGTLYALALYLGLKRGGVSSAEAKRLSEGLLQLPYRVEALLTRLDASVRALAARYAGARSFLFLGRGHSYPVALEGALKLKEISYVHAEAYAAGEMKHGPIALLEPELPVFVVAPRDSLYEKTISNIQETRARKAPVLAVGTEGDTLLSSHVEQVIAVPWAEEELTPFLTVIPLQLFAYHVALSRGCPIDQPRNLAKSVTVE
ncbi:MAG TPA: glutamine--fructose-6-phosphate transaminase (isomerizing) [Synergistaceae bacterium]|nr:glutamine--fructose-6-phosphate transaminase (isomerizing) [Synergistaceae bacterium]HQF90772.1 glutamine--fructose-6-phosphate transaminase (isomerizing) [Synergistaceae bacterium]HQH77890.1 glutamine--fructose-6-phosphate transaminase (isomerizing) [Synergistaceae bacterium]HQK24036.1 glutamine--fructose-6-phosphate transaminase (isomerizing) [Synergistaceae bacterium]